MAKPIQEGEGGAGEEQRGRFPSPWAAAPGLFAEGGSPRLAPASLLPEPCPARSRGSPSVPGAFHSQR